MRKRVIAVLSLLAALAVLGAIAWKLDWKATREVLARTGAWGAAGFAGLGLLVLFLQSVGWWALLRSRGWPVPLRTAYASMIMGNAVAWVTPSMYLGGEPLRIWHVSRRFSLPSRDVAATVVAGKFAEMAGFVTALLVCTGTMLWNFDLSPGLKWGSSAAAAGLLVAFVVLAAAFAGKWPLASGVMRLFGKRLERARLWLEATEAGIEETFRGHRGAFAAALVLTGGPLALVVARPLVFFWLTGQHVTFPALALIFVLTQIVLAFQFTPGGLGLFEGGLIGTFALVGLGSAEAAAFAAIQRLADAVVVGIGVALAAREGASGFFRGRPDGQSDLAR